MRMGHAVQLLNRYESQLAADCYRTALDLMEEMKVSRGKAEPLMGLCLLHGREGAVESALACGEEALAETEKARDFWLSTLDPAFHGDRLAPILPVGGGRRMVCRLQPGLRPAAATATV